MTTTKLYRHPGEDAVRPEKEKGTTPFEIAPRNDTGNSTVEPSRETERERGIFFPLAWAQLARELKLAKFKGRHKLQAHADAIRAKHNQGAIDLQLVGLIALATVAGLLLVGVV